MEAAESEEEVPSSAFYGVWGTILGANALAIWCEFQMGPDESLLQGLATAQIPENKKEEQEEELSIPYIRRNTTKYRISIQYR